MPVQTPESPQSIQLRPPEIEINMQELSHTLLDDAGNLELSHNLPHPVEIHMGNTALTLSSIEHPLVPGEQITEEERISRPHAYALRNAEGDYKSILLFGHGTDEAPGQGVIIGRNTTPDLVKGDPTVSGSHLKIEVDQEARRIRVRDLDSTNGTRIKVRVDKVVRPEDKQHVRRDGRVMTKPEAEGRWVR